MPTDLIPQITNAGLMAAFNASNDGLEAKITHIAFGVGRTVDGENVGYTPDRAAVWLKDEKARVAVGGGERISDFQIHVAALLEGDDEFPIWEVGFFLEDGTLFALWSDSEYLLAYKTAGIELVTGFDLVLQDIPAASVTVNVTGPSVNILFVKELAAIAEALANSNRRQFDLTLRLEAAEQEIARLSGRNVLAAADVERLKDLH